jgi:hypothetical protein
MICKDAETKEKRRPYFQIDQIWCLVIGRSKMNWQFKAFLDANGGRVPDYLRQASGGGFTASLWIIQGNQQI